jgi:hypothetical protein
MNTEDIFKRIKVIIDGHLTSEKRICKNIPPPGEKLTSRDK